MSELSQRNPEEIVALVESLDSSELPESQRRTVTDELGSLTEKEINKVSGAATTRGFISVFGGLLSTLAIGDTLGNIVLLAIPEPTSKVILLSKLALQVGILIPEILGAIGINKVIKSFRRYNKALSTIDKIKQSNDLA